MPAIQITLRRGEPLQLNRDTDQEIQDLVSDIAIRRREKGGMIQLKVFPGEECLFFASDVVRMDISRLSDENMRFTQII